MMPTTNTAGGFVLRLGAYYLQDHDEGWGWGMREDATRFPAREVAERLAGKVMGAGWGRVSVEEAPGR